MANHPNRSKFRHPAQRPDPLTIAAARRAMKMTQREAAGVVYGTESAWRAWEEGNRPMHAGLWELFRIKTLDAQILKALGLARSSPSEAPIASTTGMPTSAGTPAPAGRSTTSRDTP